MRTSLCLILMRNSLSMQPAWSIATKSLHTKGIGYLAEWNRLTYAGGRYLMQANSKKCQPAFPSCTVLQRNFERD